MDEWPVIVHACCRRGACCRPGACRHGGRRHRQFHGHGARHGHGAHHGLGAGHGRGVRHGCGACHGRGARQIKIDQRINVLYFFRIHGYADLDPDLYQNKTDPQHWYTYILK